MKKKVDSRIRQTLEDAVSNNHRAFIVLVGDKGRDQVVNLHYMLSKLTLQARPSVLWCYKTELGFSSNKKKRMKVIKKRIKQGLVDPNRDDPFELFISSTTIRFSYYSESHKILGNTYGMCVLQDFSALTPNLLARTIETVSGGGLIVLLINNMNSLKQLFSLSMDVHSRMRTEAHSKVVPRFNERFILSLSDCPGAIVADDELNVLPISSHVRSLTGSTGHTHSLLPVTTAKPGETTAQSPELKELKASLIDTPPIGALIEKTKTIDQAKALLRFEEAISEKTLRTTVALTASRGRGKSASLGLAVAAAIAHDYSNIFVTSPSPENLRTFFAFLFIGFDALDMKEHTDYEILQSNDPAMNKAVVRVNIFRNHRQTVQYIQPTDAANSLAQAELLVIDEAAAIPLPVVEKMLGPYVVFMCSTVTGYEGTGRSLSLKLMKKLREGSNAMMKGKTQSNTLVNGLSNRQADRDASQVATGSGAGRVFREVQMETPIRYGEKDPVEAWLYDLLCLEAGGKRQILTGGAPHPDECELYYVERDALFSRHSASEDFLHKIMALFVSSHYKNSPNDLQMLSDAPAHGLFVLLAPTRPDTDKLPDVLCAVQVCLEGKISSQSSKKGLSRGQRASGDLIPWTISQQYQEPDFATLAGARIVRIATHPDVQKMGYGTRAIKLLLEYYAGKNISLGLKTANDSNGNNKIEKMDEEQEMDSKESILLKEVVGPRQNIPPLLLRLHERSPERLDYVGVSFGLTQGLYNFWNRLGFVPLYMRLTSNDLTGEHTCIMATTKMNDQEESSTKWIGSFHHDFRRRFIQLLGYDFKKLSAGLAMAILEGYSQDEDSNMKSAKLLTYDDIKNMFSPYDRRRLESYARNLVDYHVIVDMLPKLAEQYCLGHFGEDLRLSQAQTAILMALGLQRKSVDDLEKELTIQGSQVLALFNKVTRKISSFLRTVEEEALASKIGPKDGDESVAKLVPRASIPQTLDAELSEKAAEMKGKAKNDDSKNSTEATPLLNKFKIQGTDEDWKEALSKNPEDTAAGIVSVKAMKRKSEASKDNTPQKNASKVGKKKRKKG